MHVRVVAPESVDFSSQKCTSISPCRVCTKRNWKPLCDFSTYVGIPISSCKPYIILAWNKESHFILSACFPLTLENFSINTNSRASPIPNQHYQAKDQQRNNKNHNIFHRSLSPAKSSSSSEICVHIILCIKISVPGTHQTQIFLLLALHLENHHYKR